MRDPILSINPREQLISFEERNGMGYGDTNRFRHLRGEKRIWWNCLILLRDSDIMIGNFCLNSICILFTLIQVVTTVILVLFYWSYPVFWWWMVLDGVRVFINMITRFFLCMISNCSIRNLFKKLLINTNIMGICLSICGYPVYLGFIFLECFHAHIPTYTIILFICSTIIFLIFHVTSSIPCLRSINNDLILFAMMNDRKKNTYDNTLNINQAQMDVAIAASLGFEPPIIPELKHIIKKEKQIEERKILIQQQNKEYKQTLLDDQFMNEKNIKNWEELPEKIIDKKENKVLKKTNKNYLMSAHIVLPTSDTNSLSKEPIPGTKTVVNVRIHMPSGSKICRRFLANDKIYFLFKFLELNFSLPPYQHFRLVSNYPHHILDKNNNLQMTFSQLGIKHSVNFYFEFITKYDENECT